MLSETDAPMCLMKQREKGSAERTDKKNPIMNNFQGNNLKLRLLFDKKNGKK